MKKIFLSLIFISLFISTVNIKALAHCHHSHYYSQPPRMLIGKTYYQNEFTFNNCNEHFLYKETVVYHYSDGSKNYFYNYGIINKDKTFLIENCSDIQHIIFNNEHYFLIKKNGYYNIIDKNGVLLTQNKYKTMTRLDNNTILVKSNNKRFGIIDIKGNEIIPIKYHSFEQIKKDLFITKLNGYYGLINTTTNKRLKNEYDKIKPLQNTLLLKKYDKYGLANNKGEVILPTIYNKIEQLEQFILIKEKSQISILNNAGKKITDKTYKKIRINRNTLEGLTNDKKWIKIEDI